MQRSITRTPSAAYDENLPRFSKDGKRLLYSHDGRIATIGDLKAAYARRRIDASGLTVAPGFIDMHNHSDYTILVEPKAESMIRQGVTSMIFGEGGSAAPGRRPS